MIRIAKQVGKNKWRLSKKMEREDYIMAAMLLAPVGYLAFQVVRAWVQ